METDVLTVPPDATVSEFVWFHAMGQRQPTVPVVDGNQYLGLCSIHDAAKIERSMWDETKVTDILDDSVPTGRPSWSIRDAVAAMGQVDIELVAITDNAGAFIGLVRDSEIVKLDEILVETESQDSD